MYVCVYSVLMCMLQLKEREVAFPMMMTMMMMGFVETTHPLTIQKRRGIIPISQPT